MSINPKTNQNSTLSTVKDMKTILANTKALIVKAATENSKKGGTK